jgi:hypothetical protein
MHEVIVDGTTHFPIDVSSGHGLNSRPQRGGEMTNRFLVCCFLLIGVASLAHAAPARGRARGVGLPANPVIIQLVEMPTADRFVQDLPPEPCGSIDPNRPCYMGSTTDPCIKATSYTSCTKRCECQFTQNKKKCKASPVCIDLATSEKNACTGACLTDWT